MLVPRLLPAGAFVAALAADQMAAAASPAPLPRRDRAAALGDAAPRRKLTRAGHFAGSPKRASPKAWWLPAIRFLSLSAF